MRQELDILFVGPANSVHTARWIGNVVEMGFKVALFPTQYVAAHPDMPDIPVFYPHFLRSNRFSPSARLAVFRRRYDALTCLINPKRPRGIHYQSPSALKALIHRLRPRIVHALELQHAGYQALEAIDDPNQCFGINNWGSDVIFYQTQKAHLPWLKSLLSRADFYSAECDRDSTLVRDKYDYQGWCWQTVPASSARADAVFEIAASAPVPSTRKRILIKGYEHAMGKALWLLEQLESCAKELQPYHLTIFSPNRKVRRIADDFYQKTGVTIEFIKHCSPERMQQLFMESRCYMGASLSDGISTSMSEALINGTFPLQTDTACCEEWFEHGKTGYMLSFNDMQTNIANMKRALTDDALVDQAAIANQQCTRERLSRQAINPIIENNYKSLLEKIT